MSNARILVVDDEPFNLEILEELLSENYQEIVFAKDGFECLEKIGGFNPDLVLLDVSMPLMDGYQCCKKIKENPLYKNLPVIFISARGNSEERLMGYSAGGADYIVKPFDGKELLIKVERTLTYVKNAKTLAFELDATKNIALESMTANSELGQVMQFCEKLFSIQTFDTLLETTLDFFCNYDLDTIGLLIKEGNKYCVSLSAICTPLEMDLINLLKGNLIYVIEIK
ncbi:MAG: response regulator [Saccharospirillaceae bacterium]|nr:response regulator [Pseudomonadales bacterium]NRB81129.1 response regulator [Saccharospirillaceae bacterium]